MIGTLIAKKGKQTRLGTQTGINALVTSSDAPVTSIVMSAHV